MAALPHLGTPNFINGLEKRLAVLEILKEKQRREAERKKVVEIAETIRGRLGGPVKEAVGAAIVSIETLERVLSECALATKDI